MTDDLARWAADHVAEALGGGTATLAAAGKLAQWAWAVRKARLKEARDAAEAKEKAQEAFRDLVLEKLDAAKNAGVQMAGALEGMREKLREHDDRTKVTAKAVTDAANGVARLEGEMAGLRGEVMARVARAEEDAANASHLAQESHALGVNAHARMDAAGLEQPVFGSPRSRG